MDEHGKNERSIRCAQNPWLWFDSIRCINLEERKDRRDESSVIFGKLGIPATYFTAQRHPKGGTQGCFESHINVITEAYNQGCQTLMVFEDDILPTSSYSHCRMRDIISFLETNQEWDLFFFGALPDIMRTRTYFAGRFGNTNIFRGRYLLAHAYAVSRRYMEKVANLPYTDVPIDVVYSYDPQAYTVIPSVFDQSNSPTGIEGHNTSSSRTYRDAAANACAKAFGVPLEPACIVLTVGFFILLVLYVLDLPGRLWWALILVVILAIILAIIYINGPTYA